MVHTQTRPNVQGFIQVNYQATSWNMVTDWSQQGSGDGRESEPEMEFNEWVEGKRERERTEIEKKGSDRFE